MHPSDFAELNSLVKQFLQFNGLSDTVKTFDHEIRQKVLEK